MKKQPFFYSMLGVTLVIVLAQFASAAAPRTIVVTSVNQSFDRQNIQNAIDSANEGDTIELVGAFQLDGISVHIRKSVNIIGRAIDNDNDEKTNEDWADGINNDGDNSIDEDDWDAALIGIADIDGRPAPEVGPAIFNRGLAIDAVTGSIDVSVRNLKFSTLTRGMGVYPGAEESLLCTRFSTDGMVTGLTFADNFITNCNRGFEIFGGAEHFNVENNVFMDMQRADILLVAEFSGCFNADGTPGPGVAIGEVRKGQVFSNRLTRGGGVVTVEADVISVFNNELNIRGGVQIIAGSDNSVQRNSISNTFFAVYADGFSPHSTISNNVLRDNSYGVFLDANANDFTVINNECYAEEFDYAVFGVQNKIISTDFSCTLETDSASNKLIGTLSMTNNPSFPNDVQTQLEELAAELANRQP